MAMRTKAQLANPQRFGSTSSWTWLVVVAGKGRGRQGIVGGATQARGQIAVVFGVVVSCRHGLFEFLVETGKV